MYNEILLYGLPSLRKSCILEYKFINEKGNIITKTFKQNDPKSNDEMFNFDEYLYGNPGVYKIINDILIYNHSSVQNIFKDQIIKSINDLNNEKLINVNKIIIDLRGNTGGNSSLNNYLIMFLEKHKDKKLICLTDYRIFSAGRFILYDLIKLGAITIGEEISTPINCFGNCKNINIYDRTFVISEKYFDPLENISIESKKMFNSYVKNNSIELKFFVPDIIIKQTADDYLNNRDTVLEYALNYK